MVKSALDESSLATAVRAALNEVTEEETGRKLGELNVVGEVAEDPAGSLRVRFSPISPYSPTAVETGRRIRDAALGTEGVKSVVVECQGHMQDELVNRLVNGGAKRRA